MKKIIDCQCGCGNTLEVEQQNIKGVAVTLKIILNKDEPVLTRIALSKKTLLRLINQLLKGGAL